MLFRKILTIVHLNSKLWNQLVPIPSSCGSSGAVRFSSRAVRLFPALLERGVRPSYGTFFHMVFQGNCARVRTGHMITCFRNPNWREANQLANYKRSQRIYNSGLPRNKSMKCSEWDSNPGPTDSKSNTLTTRPPCHPATLQGG